MVVIQECFWNIDLSLVLF